MTPPVPTPIGVGPAFHPAALSRAVEAGAPVSGLRCGGDGRRFGVHLELFAADRVVIVPAGIGVAPPWRRDGNYVRSGRCSYPARTREPTGVVEVGAAGLRLGDVFRVWGQPLSRTRLAGFRGRVQAFVDGRRDADDPRLGRRWAGALAAVPLRRHAEIVLEVGPFVRPHSTFLFRKGL